MAGWNTDNTIYIMAPKGYARKGIEEKGIKAFSPYHGDDLPLRLFREVCFRVPFLPKAIWYNREALGRGAEYINIIDVNIIPHYLKWIKRHYPHAQINYIYDNMVGKARNIDPGQAPEGIRVWTYDDYDARKYGMRLYKNYWVNEKLMKPKKSNKYDVFFIGRDKGRAQKLLELERRLNEMGLTTKFIITKDKKFSKEKPYYQPAISYEQVIDYDTSSRALLNITMENQEGVTMRDMESVAIGLKLITTNRNIRNKDLYHENNVFILGIDDFDSLPSFLNADYVNMWERIKGSHTFEAMMTEITTAD